VTLRLVLAPERRESTVLLRKKRLLVYELVDRLNGALLLPTGSFCRDMMV